MMKVIRPIGNGPNGYRYGINVGMATTSSGYNTTVSGYDPLYNQIPLRDFSEVADVIRENLGNFQKL